MALEARLVFSQHSHQPARLFGLGSPRDVAFSPDGRTVLLAGTHAQLFDLETGALVRQFLGHSGVIFSAAFSPDGARFVTGSGDQTAKLWNVETGEELWSLQHSNPVSAVAFSPDGGRILTAGAQGQGRVWDVATREMLGEFEAQGGVLTGMHAVAFSPDGTTIASVEAPGVIQLLDAQNFEPLRAIDTGIHPVIALAYSPDGGRMIVALGDSTTMTARLYDLETLEPFWSIDSHTNVISSVAFSPDGSWIATASWDWTARIWDPETGQELQTIEQAGGVSALDISPDNQLLLTSSARVWDAQTGELVQTMQNETTRVRSFALSPDGAWILTGNVDNAARLWERDSGRLIHKFEGHQNPVEHVSFTPDGAAIITGSADGTVKWWDAATWEELQFKQFPGRSGKPLSLGPNLVISPDQSRLLTAPGFQHLLFDLETEEQLFALNPFPPGGDASAFSPDSRQIIIASLDRAKLWDAETGEELQTYNYESGPVSSVAFSPDGSRFLTTDVRRVRGWDTATAERLWTLEVQPSGENSAAFSPDGREVLTVNSQGNAALWDAESGELLRSFNNPPLLFSNFAAFSPDGNWIFIGDSSTLLMWERNTVDSVVPLRVTEIERPRPNVIMRVEGPAADAFPLVVESRADWSPDSDWEEEPEALAFRRENHYEVRLPRRPGKQRFYRAFVVPPVE